MHQYRNGLPQTGLVPGSVGFLPERSQNYQEVHGNDHPDVASSKCKVAFTLVVQGKLEEAKTLLLECERIYAKVFGDVHEETQDARDRVAVIEELCKLVDCRPVRRRKRGPRQYTKGSAKRRKTQRGPGSTDRPPR